jgi:4a-hydroxytetrahydrobiopterin dehydratase
MGKASGKETKLSADEIKKGVADLKTWRHEPPAITRLFQFKDFMAAIAFVNAVAAEAEKANHHPDIDIRWNKVILRLTTHDSGGLTKKDFAVAKVCEDLGGKHGAVRS